MCFQACRAQVNYPNHHTQRVLFAVCSISCKIIILQGTNQIIAFILMELQLQIFFNLHAGIKQAWYQLQVGHRGCPWQYRHPQCTTQVWANPFRLWKTTIVEVVVVITTATTTTTTTTTIRANAHATHIQLYRVPLFFTDLVIWVRSKTTELMCTCSPHESL